jgi:hypothetical protein
MKKWLSIVLVSCYLLITLGVQLHLHYCCGELSDIHLFNRHSCDHQQDNSDPCCKKSNCCSYVYLDFKVDDSHQPTASTEAQLQQLAIMPVLSTPQASIVRCEQTYSLQADASPPPIGHRYVLFHSLILYA